MTRSNSTPKKATPREEVEAIIQNVVAGISPTNHAFVSRFITKRLNRGGSANTVMRYAYALQHADKGLPGVSIPEATPDDWVDFLAYLRGAVGPSTMHHVSVVVKAVLKTVHGKALPEPYADALWVKRPKRGQKHRILADADLYELLEAVKANYGRLRRLPAVEQMHAMVWALWDSGFRASELLSLQVGDVVLDDQGGAQLDLVERPHMPPLKTGPRTIYVVECVGPLKAWLGLHPAGHDGRAPLWPGLYDRSGGNAMSYGTFYKIITRLGQVSGVSQSGSRDKGLSPHDFRHTRATRAARAGWGEAKLNAYFGWAPESKEAATYIHLALSDLKEQVRRDAGIDDDGYRLASQRGDDAAALAELLQKALQRNRGTTTATRRPEEWERR